MKFQVTLLGFFLIIMNGLAYGQINRTTNLASYFPTKVNTTWTYTIKYDKSRAIMAKETLWPLANGQKVVLDTRTTYAAKKQSSYGLILKIDKKAAAIEPFKNPDSVEIKIIKDELSIFRDVKNLFWSIPKENGYFISLVETFDLPKDGSETNSILKQINNRAVGSGMSARLYLFAEKPGSAAKMGISNTIENLIFIGLNKGQLHYRRVIQAKPVNRGTSTDFINKAFTEDYYFKKDVGLYYMEQKVENKISMTWKLIKYIPGK